MDVVDQLWPNLFLTLLACINASSKVRNFFSSVWNSSLLLSRNVMVNFDIDLTSYTFKDKGSYEADYGRKQGPDHPR